MNIKSLVCRRTLALLMGAALLTTALFVPTRKVEASGGSTAAVAIFTGAAGLMLGTAIGQAASHKKHRRQPRKCSSQNCNQRLIMSNVLARYNPAYHDYWVEYVLVDLQGYLTPPQQQQLLNTLEHKRNRWHRSCY